MRLGKSKYGNRKVEIDGIIFDSKREAKRYQELLLLEQSGEISCIQRQQKFVLIKAQYDKKGKCLERECSYKADFVYWKDGILVVEDAKGFRTKEYIIKRKLMLWVHSIRIVEV